LSQRPTVDSGAVRSLAMRPASCIAHGIVPWPTAVEMDRASAAGCGEHCVDPPVPSRRLCGNGQATCMRAEADPCLRRQFSEGDGFINVSTYRPFPAEGCQPSIRVGMHGV
jgi:hypothetical protein